MNTSLGITLLSCAVLGFRHGVDYDHVAAISDITSVQQRSVAAMRLGLLYALGHASMIAVLGTAVILFQRSLPPKLDSWAERLIGLTLIIFAIYVLGNLAWGNPTANPPSRAALLIRCFRTLRRKFTTDHLSAQLSSGRDDKFDYTRRAAFGMGVIHGLGAETPSQLALYLLAANLGGIAKGIGGMAMFLAGLLIMNTLMTASACGLSRSAAPHPRAKRVFIGITAAYSLAVGCVFLFDLSVCLPALG